MPPMALGVVVEVVMGVVVVVTASSHPVAPSFETLYRSSRGSSPWLKPSSREFVYDARVTQSKKEGGGGRRRTRMTEGDVSN